MLNTENRTNALLKMIRATKVERDKAIAELYTDQELNNKILSNLLKNGGKHEDFDVIFNTTLLQFIKTVAKNDTFEINSSIHNYIVGIAKYVWYKELKTRKKTKYVEIGNYFELKTETTPESLVIDHSRKELVSKLLNQVGSKCKEVLMYWANGYKMKEIAKFLGYKSEGMARKKKHQCFKELLVYVDNNPEIKNILL